MRLFFSSLLTLMAGILPFLRHIFTKVLLPHAMRLMASAASCMGSFWGWLEQVVSSMGPWHLVRKATPAVPHYQHLDTDTQIILTDFLSGACCPTFSRCNSNLFFGRVLVYSRTLCLSKTQEHACEYSEMLTVKIEIFFIQLLKESIGGCEEK